jgi:hypothetical protein
MWRRALCSLAVVGLGGTTLPAQEFLWAGYARTVALGQTAEAFKDGYLLDVGVAWKVGSRDDLSLQTGLLYGGNHVQGVGGTVDLWGLTVGLGYSPITVGPIEPYLIGGTGYLRRTDFGSNSGDLAYYAGGGIHGHLGDVAGWWLEARYLGAGSGDQRLELLPVTLGLTLPLKRR